MSQKKCLKTFIILTAFFCLGKGFALRRRLFFAKQKSEAAQAKGAEQKEFYAPPLTKKVQNKENHPDKAEKEIGEIL